MRNSRFARRLYRTISFFGLDPLRLFTNLKSVAWYSNDLLTFKAQRTSDDFKITSLFPVLTDKSDTAGRLPKHYFKQDLLVAQHVFNNKPVTHVDVGSRIDGFVANVASFRPIEVIDIRPMELELENFKFLQIDLMQPLQANYNQYTDSLSCLHALEHFGLGRYGDKIDFDGHLKGYNNLKQMLKPGGLFYFSVPIGPQRIEFNAHRVFSVSYLLKMVEPDFTVEDFYFIDDDNMLHHQPDLEMANATANSFGCNYGCGIFILRKR